MKIGPEDLENLRVKIGYNCQVTYDKEDHIITLKITTEHPKTHKLLAYYFSFNENDQEVRIDRVIKNATILNYATVNEKPLILNLLKRRKTRNRRIERAGINETGRGPIFFLQGTDEKKTL